MRTKNFLGIVYVCAIMGAALLIDCSGKKEEAIDDESYMAMVCSAAEVVRRDIEPSFPTPKAFSSVVEKASEELKMSITQSMGPEEVAGLFIKQIYETWGIGFDSNRTNLYGLFPHTILQRKSGSCLGVSLLFLILAEQTGVPFHGVIIPTHFFVRFDNDTARFNLEPNRRGYCYTDKRYREKYGVAGRPWYTMKNLTREEVAAALSYNLGNICRIRGLHEKAVVFYAEALEGLKEFPEALGNAGISYAYLGRINDAVTALRRAKLSDPGLENISKNLGTMLLRAGRYKDAVQELSEAVGSRPGDPDLHYSLGVGYYYIEDYERALKELSCAITLRPGYSDARALVRDIKKEISD
ncbi:MAG: tetratricopeptide repeat protein [Chitinivibrionales bacterium]|nr:tetratricopeptide repeat protein [Chitinivibrionales bacterium]